MGHLSMDLYLKNLRSSYKKSGRKKKGELLEQFCEMSGFHRKHAIRVLNNSPKRSTPQKRGRKTLYEQEEYMEPLKQIWLLADQMCGKRLKQALQLWLPHYGNTYGELSPEVYNSLLSMSASTIDRMLSSVRSKGRKSLCGTKPGSILKTHIPVKTGQWDEAKPGFIEADTVAHCGDSMQGSFTWTLTLTDIFSEWTELRAVWNKGSEGVVEQIKDVESVLPFELLGFDSDNGSEFLNWHLVRYFSNFSGEHRIQLTRSRPYKKNDNAHVEQKNWTHVRHLLGYHRIDNKKVIPLLNDLYRNEVSMLNNFFLPNFKLLEKQRIKSKIVKKHSVPETPYQRLMSSEHVSIDAKKKLQETYEKLNPFELHRVIQKKLRRISAFINVRISSKRTAI